MITLVVTNAEDATANYLIPLLRLAGVTVVRLNTERLATSYDLMWGPNKSELSIDGFCVAPSDIGSVWYRRPRPVRLSMDGLDDAELSLVAREWTASLESFLASIPSSRWVNHPSLIMSASGKLEQLQRAAVLGLQVPDWICTTCGKTANGFIDSHTRNVIVKPISDGFLERPDPQADTLIYTNALPEDFKIEPHLGAPTLIQQRLRGARDVRITAVGADYHAFELRRNDEIVDIRRNNMSDVSYSPTTIPSSVEQSLRRLIESYDLKFSAVDMVVKDECWWFLENNPNGQWAWMDIIGVSQIHSSFSHLFAEMNADVRR